MIFYAKNVPFITARTLVSTFIITASSSGDDHTALTYYTSKQKVGIKLSANLLTKSICLVLNITLNFEVGSYASVLPLLKQHWKLVAMYTYAAVVHFLPARRYASAGLCDSDVSVCLSVCHTPVL